MSDNKPSHKGSFSVYVPEDADGAEHKSYFRLGGGNPYSPDGEPFEDYDTKFGIYFYTDGDKKEVVKGKNKLDLKADGDQLISASYDFELENDGMKHEAKWSRASNTDVAISDKRELVFAQKTTFGASSWQQVVASMPFTASLGISVAAKLDPLSVEMSWSDLVAKSTIPKLGNFELQDEQDTRATTRVAMTAAPHDIPALTAVKGCVIAYQVAVGVVAGLSTGLMMVPMAGTAVVADEDGSKDDEVEEWLKALAASGVTMGSLITLLQAAGVVLGGVVVGMATPARALDVAASGQVVVTPAALQMRVGPTSFISITPFSLVLNAPTVSVNASQMAFIPAPMTAVPI